jgi:hypothetical protein
MIKIYFEAEKSAWSVSRAEEVISGIWLIAGVVAMGIGYETLGKVLLVKAAIDFISSIWFSVKEIRKVK